MRAAIVRIARGGAALAVLAAIAGGAWYGFDTISAQPIRRVAITGELGRIARSDLDAFARAVQGAGGASSLDAVREAARRIPWVREATVRRRFPDAVEVRFESHEPLARWGEGVLVSTRGEIFHADYDGELPRLSGPDAAAATMARELPAIAQALAPLRASVSEIRLSRRGAWQVVAGELTLELGRGDIHARLARFAAAWPQVAAGAARHADLRYPNGFALREKRS